MASIAILLTIYIYDLQINIYIYIIRSSSTAVSIGRKPEIGSKLNLLLLLNRKERTRFLRLLVFLIQALITLILLPSVVRPI